MYATPPTTFDELLSHWPIEIQQVARQLREIIRDTLPDAEENIYGGLKMGNALYSIGGTNEVVCGIQPTARSCKLFVYGWREIEHSGIKLQGSGK